MYISPRIAKYRLIADYGRTPSDLSFITAHPLLSLSLSLSLASERARARACTARTPRTPSGFFRRTLPPPVLSFSFPPSSLLSFSVSLSAVLLSSPLLSSRPVRPPSSSSRNRSQFLGRQKVQCTMLRTESGGSSSALYMPISRDCRQREIKSRQSE